MCDKKWIDANDLLNGQYSVNKNIRFKTIMLQLDLCYYNDAYFVVREKINPLAAAANKDDKARSMLHLKIMHYQGYFSHVLHAVSSHSALFEKLNATPFTKNSKTTCCSGGCSVLNALNLEK